MAGRDRLSILHVLVPGGPGGLESAVRCLRPRRLRHVTQSGSEAIPVTATPEDG